MRYFEQKLLWFDQRNNPFKVEALMLIHSSNLSVFPVRIVEIEQKRFERKFCLTLEK